jgi:thermosome
MIVEVARTQEDEVGDGTTTAVIIAGELLKNAQSLLEQNIHPSIIIKGYRIAQSKSLEILGRLATDIKEKDTETLEKISQTAMTGKGAEIAKEHLSRIVVKAISRVTENGEPETENIKLCKKHGDSVENTELVEGIVIDKERAHSGMPKKAENAKIAMIDLPIEIRDTEIDAKIQITDPEKIQQFLDIEEKMLRDMVQKIEKSGANVIFCQKGIDEIAQFFLSQKGFLAVRRVKKSDMEKLAKATGATIVNNLEQLAPKSLGYARLVQEKKIGNENFIFVEKCNNPKAVTILIRGATEHVVDEVERAVRDSIGDIASAVKSKKVVAGAGACEIEISKELSSFAGTFKGKEQLAVESFAKSLEVVPKTLAENSGFDPIDLLAELKSSHDKGEKWAGISVAEGKIKDSWKEGVIEPLKIKTQAINSATEVAVMILRVDDVIAAAKKKQTSQENPLGEEQ